MVKGIDCKESNKELKGRPPHHFGDVMSSTETSVLLLGDFTPLERIALTANGNLQRILSAFYNSPVRVDIIKNQEIPLEDNSSQPDSTIVYDREVNLICNGEVLCKAISNIKLTGSKIIRLIRDEGVGVGQLFRYLNVLPEFKLLKVGRTEDDNKLFRTYILSTNGAECTITEYFSSNLFQN